MGDSRVASVRESVFDRARRLNRETSEQLSREIAAAGGIDAWRAQQAAKPEQHIPGPSSQTTYTSEWGESGGAE